MNNTNDLGDRILDVIREHIRRGESYSWRSASEPIGIRGGGVYTSVRGDLCDLRDDVERVIREARA